MRLPVWLAVLLSPGYGRCEHCGMPWRFAEPHNTVYYDDGTSTMGCFPLCERCWLALASPAARLPFYRALAERWGPAERNVWPAIREAVLAGG